MATFRKRGSKWRVELSVNGRRRSGTFATRKEAKLWADNIGDDLQRMEASGVPDLPFSELMDRYVREIIPQKRGASREQKMVGVILRDPLADVPLPSLTARDIAEWRDRRLKQVSNATVNREITILSHACNIALREWGWLVNNPVRDIRRPPSTPERTRRPTDEEIEALLYALGYARDQPPETTTARVGAAWLFAIETAMRAGEICGIGWEDVHDRHVHLPMTKNGFPRDVPLSLEARRLIEQLRDVTGERPTVFDVKASITRCLVPQGQGARHDRRPALPRQPPRSPDPAVEGLQRHAACQGQRPPRRAHSAENVYYYNPTIDDLADRMDEMAAS